MNFDFIPSIEVQLFIEELKQWRDKSEKSNLVIGCTECDIRFK